MPLSVQSSGVLLRFSAEETGKASVFDCWRRRRFYLLRSISRHQVGFKQQVAIGRQTVDDPQIALKTRVYLITHANRHVFEEPHLPLGFPVGISLKVQVFVEDIQNHRSSAFPTALSDLLDEGSQCFKEGLVMTSSNKQLVVMEHLVVEDTSPFSRYWCRQ